MDKVFEKALAQVCRALNEHHVAYLTIGGLAVAAHGYVKSTADFDFWYEPTISNYTNILSALKSLEVDVSRLDDHVFDPEKTYLRIPFEGIPIEFLPKMVGLDSFREAKGRAEIIKVLDTGIPVMSRDDLILNKSRLGRTRDLLDVEELMKRRKGRDTV